MFGNLGTVWAEMGLDTTKLDMGVTRAAASFKALQGHEASLTKAMKGAAIGIGVVGAAIAAGAVKLAADYDKNMRKVWSLTEESEATFKRWKSEVLELASDLPQSAAQMADAFYWIKSDMPDATDAQQMKTLEIAAKGAVGGIADLSETTNALVQAQNAYNDLDPAKYMDIMNKAVERGAIELKDFVAFQGAAVGSAAMAGVSFEELAAGVSTLTRKAIPANTAFMALNNTIMGHLKPTDEAAETAAKYGINLSLATLRSQGLAGSLMEIANKVPDEELARLFPNIRSLKAVLPLAGLAADDFAADLAAMGASAGTTDRMYEKNADTIENKWKIAVGKAQNALIKLGDKALPAVSGFLDKISSLLDGNNEAFNKFASVLGAVAKGAWNLGDALLKLWPLVIAGGAAFAAWKVSGIVSSIVSASGSFAGLSHVITNLSLGFSGFNMAFSTLGTTLGTAGLMAAPFVIATALLVKNLRDADAAGEKAANTIRKNDVANRELGLQLQPLIDRYEELRAITGRSVEQQAEMVSVGNQIAQLAPTMASGFDDVGNAIIKSDAQLNQLIDDLLKYSGINIEGKGDLGKMSGLIGSKEEFTKTASEMQSALNDISVNLYALGVDGADVRNVLRMLSGDFDQGSESARAYIQQLKDAGLSSAGWSKQSWEAGNIKAVEDALKNLDQSYKQNGMTLDEVRRKISETDIAMAQLRQQMVQTASEKGFAEGATSLPTSLAEGLRSGVPQMKQATTDLMAATAAGMLQARGVLSADAGGLAQQIAQTIATGADWDGTGGQAGQEVYDAIKAELAARGIELPKIKPEVDNSNVKDFWKNIGGIFEGGKTKQKVSVNVSDSGSGASTKKSLDQVKASADTLGKQKPTVHANANTAQANAAVARLVNRCRELNGQTLATVNIRAQIVGSGPFTADEYARYLEDKIAGASPQLTVNATLGGGGLGGGGDMVSELQAAMNAAGTLAGWSTSRMSPMGDMSIEDWNHMNEAIASLGGNVEANLTSWWNMNGALIKAKTSMEGYQTAIEVAEKSIEKLQNRENALNKELSEHKNRLSELSQMKLKGEGAADDKSFAAQHELNRLQVELLKAQKEGRFNDAARIAADKRKLEKDKELLDAQTTYQFEAQKRAVEKALDPMKGQEMTQQALIKAIKTEQKAIADKEKQIARVQAVLEKERLKVAQLRAQYDAISKTVRSFTTKINEMARNFLDQYQKMIAAQEELNRKMAEGGDLGGGNLGVSPNRVIASARATTNISSTSMSSSADMNIYGDVVINNPVGDMTDVKHELRMAGLRRSA